MHSPPLAFFGKDWHHPTPWQTASLKPGALAVAVIFMLLIAGARAIGIRRSGIYIPG